MSRKLVFAVATATAALLSLSAYAQTPADVQRVSKIVGGDAGKKQAYCAMAKLEQQIGEADQKKDTKKVEELSKQYDELVKKVGPEYAKLTEALDKVDPNSADGKKLAPAMQEMAKMCPR